MVKVVVSLVNEIDVFSEVGVVNVVSVVNVVECSQYSRSSHVVSGVSIVVYSL